MEEKLLKKWLNNELSVEELESFKKLDEYSSYAKILESAKYFKAPEFDEASSLEGLNFALDSRKKSSNNSVLKLLMSIAAVIIIGAFVINISYSSLEDDTIKTSVASTEQIALPDNSEVSLNAKSTLTYDSSTWEDSRNLELEGEALFEVEKGQKFTVNTEYGNVEVLGTIFNVKARDYTFEVTCFEGSVNVEVNDSSHVLKPGDVLRLENSEILKIKTSLSAPDWRNSMTVVQSKSLNIVLKEFLNYYDVEFNTDNVDISRIYTGSFGHNDMKTALKSITLPLGLTHEINGKTIFLSKK